MSAQRVDKIVCSGALVYAMATGRILLLQKAHGKHAGIWGLVGGTNLKNENPWQGLQREIVEEVGLYPDTLKVIPLEAFVSNDNVFKFYTYLCVVENEFIPVLSNEHNGWAWANIASCPRPLHQGLRTSFSDKIFKAKLDTIFNVIKLI